MTNVFCAIDLGATSGRIILSEDGNTLQEVCRFPNAVENHDGKVFWNISLLFDHIRKGLAELAQRTDIRITSIGVDTWGVDVVFLDANGQALAEPRAYRDPYSTARMEQFFSIVPRERIYEKTGIQFLTFNTLYQLYACHCEQYEPFLKAASYLFIPDYISYLLTGKQVCEYTALSTSQLLNPRTKKIDEELVQAAGANMSCFPPIVYPGEQIGILKKEIADFGYDIPVIAVAGHDTASAVAAVPRTHEGKKVAYLSSGTWSLMGTVTDQPVITPRSLELNFTNEGGVEGTTRLLKNITGMWILEQCRKEWAAQGKDYSHPQLIEMAQSAEAYEIFNPDETRFANPASMIEQVKNGHDLSEAQIVASIFHSLAHRYGEVFAMLQSLVPETIGALYIIGGGARNQYLNQLTAQAVGVPVLIGSTESTALGNILIQKNRK